MNRPSENNSVPVGWPSILAAQNIRTSLLDRISQQLDEEADEIGEPLMRRFLHSLANPIGRRRLKEWFKFLSEANKLVQDNDKQKKIAEAEKLWKELYKLEGQNPDKITDDRDLLKQLFQLFELLLGLCIMRPIVGDAAQKSSIYYSTIYHPLLDEKTKQIILETVMVPPGAGSIGRCLRIKSSCISNSLADYAGVVEWQDLVQGNISILMVHVETKIYEDEEEADLSYIVMVFFPLYDIFNKSNSPSNNNIEKLEDLYGFEGECNTLADVLRECAENGVKNSRSEDFQCSDNNYEKKIISQITGALLDYQEQWRTLSLSRKILKNSEKEGLDKIVSSFTDRLIPESFTDLPMPLVAAAAQIRDSSSRSEQTGIAHMRVSKRGLESAFQAIMPYEIAPKIAKRFPNHSDDLVTQGVDDKQLGRIGQLHPQMHKFSDFYNELYYSHDFYLGSDEHEFEAVWTIHAKNNKQLPEDGYELAKIIHKPLSQILKVAETYAGWNPDKLYQEWKNWIGDKVDKVPNHVLSLYAQLKLRDNIGERYYNLISRLLFANDESVRQRHNELRFMLTICATAPGPDVSEYIYEIVEQACKAALQLREMLQSYLKKDFLGTSSGVRMRHHLDWTAVEKNRVKELLLASRNPELWKTMDNSFGYMRRLIHILQIRGTLNQCRFPQSFVLNDDKQRWKWQTFYGSVLKLNGTRIINETVHVDALLSVRETEIEIKCQVSPKLTFATELHPDNSRNLPNQWVEKSLDEIQDFLQIELLPITESRSKTDDKMNAAIYVGFSKSDSEAKELYLKKLRVMSTAFKEMMDDRFQAIEDAERFAEEKGRADTAELLVSGTSHNLKIPFQVAKKLAEKGMAKEAAQILEIAVGFVTVGAYVQHHRRRERNKKTTYERLINFVPVPQKPNPDSFLLQESTVIKWLELAVRYVELSFGIIIPPAEALHSPGLWLDWRLEHTYTLKAGGGGYIFKEEAEAAVFISAFTEIVANAITYSNSVKPHVIISFSSTVPNRLVCGIENNLDGEPKWKNVMEYEDFAARTSGVIGVRTAKWACESLGWSFNVDAYERDGQWYQRIEFIAPVQEPSSFFSE